MDSRPYSLHFPVDEMSAVESLRDADILFSWSFTPEMFHAAHNLKWVHIGGAGMDKIIFPEIRESSITLTNSSGMHGTPIAEWTLAALLFISQHLRVAEEWHRDRDWKSHKNTLTRERFILSGKRALIVGYGSIGTAIAERLQSLGVHCEGIATASRPAPILIHTLDQLSAIIGGFDIVIVALPLTTLTKGLFNQDLFARMKPGSIFVNIARGQIADEAALNTALKSGPLAYAALDVFAQEPLPADSPLFDLPNVFMSPHVSGNFPEYSAVANQIFLENLRRYANGEPLQNIVDKHRGY